MAAATCFIASSSLLLLQVVKYLIDEEVRGKQRRVYGMRLKVNRDNRLKAQELGLALSSDGSQATSAPSNAAAAAPAVSIEQAQPAAAPEMR